MNTFLSTNEVACPVVFHSTSWLWRTWKMFRLLRVFYLETFYLDRRWISISLPIYKYNHTYIYIFTPVHSCGKLKQQRLHYIRSTLVDVLSIISHQQTYLGGGEKTSSLFLVVILLDKYRPFFSIYIYIFLWVGFSSQVDLPMISFRQQKTGETTTELELDRPGNSEARISCSRSLCKMYSPVKDYPLNRHIYCVKNR